MSSFTVPVTIIPARGKMTSSVTVRVRVQHAGADTYLFVEEESYRELAYTRLLARYTLGFDTNSILSDGGYHLRDRLLYPLFVFISYGGFCSCCTNDYRVVMIEAENYAELCKRLEDPTIVDTIFMPMDYDRNAKQHFMDWNVAGLRLTAEFERANAVENDKERDVFTGHLTDFKTFATYYSNPDDWINELGPNGPWCMALVEADYVFYYGKNYECQELSGMLEGVPPNDYNHTKHTVCSFPITHRPIQLKRIDPFESAVPSVMYEADVCGNDGTDFERKLLTRVKQVEDEQQVVLTASCILRYSCWSGKFAGGDHLYHVSVTFNTAQVPRDVGETAVYRLYYLLHKYYNKYALKIFRVQSDCLVVGK